MQKRLLILFIMLGLATAYSLISLVMTNDDYEKSTLGNEGDFAPNESPVQARKKANTLPKIDHLNASLPRQSTKPAQKEIVDKDGLPIKIKVVGINDGTEAENLSEKGNANKEALVLIQIENELYEHRVNDFIANSSVQIVDIKKLSIDVKHETATYTINLSPPNLLASSFKEPEASYADLLKMTPTEIGTRPRIIEHLLRFTPTPYIADGNIISPGLNPDLFAQAGFKDDDVLKTINGKSVTVESELEDIKKELRTAQTLTFLVMRRGRLVTLYLDIPSEALELWAD